MRFRRRSFVAPSLLLSLAGTASAHPISVDGVADEWLTRQPNADDLGMIARDATGAGEFIWRDAVGDVRTDVADPEPAADMSGFAVTGDDMNLYFLIRLPVHNGASPAQVQIALDTTPGGGVGSFLAGTETNLAIGMGAEFLVRTLFANNSPSDAGAIVYNAQGQSLATVPAERGLDGIEISVPWTLLGFLSGPPSGLVRMSVAIFRAQTATSTIEVTGPDALDALTDYGNPRAAGVASPGTASEFPAGDARIDDFVDLFFSPDGEVYAPVVISRFVSNAATGSRPWFALRNVSPATRSSTSLMVGDSEAPDDSTEGMANLPAGVTMQPGGEIVVAMNGAGYSTFFAKPPTFETGASSASVPDAVTNPNWGAVPMAPAAGNDEFVVLDSSFTILDMVNWGTSAYPGLTPLTPVPASFMVATRNELFSDTDNSDVDFTILGEQCGIDAHCDLCYGCGAQDACIPEPVDTPCGDDTICNGIEACNGAGTCQTLPAPDCNDNNPCTTDLCHFANGCYHGSASAGTGCNDGNACTTNDGCNGSGQCGGTPLDCNMPPFPECISDSVSRKFTGGMCLDGGCTYQAQDSSCENGCDADTGLCSDDPCFGLTCNSPPPCMTWSGSCVANACVYIPNDGAVCNDGDACTALDSCDGTGTCGGVPVQCNNPPAPSCVNGMTSRVYNASGNCNAGQCSYEFRDDSCATMCNAQTGLCDNDPCAGVSCDMSPGQCYLAIGQCSAGDCNYDPQVRGALCNDGNPCTIDDICDGSGNCGGQLDPNCGAGGSGTGGAGMSGGGNGGGGAGGTAGTANGGAAGNGSGGAAGSGSGGAAAGTGGNAGTTGGGGNSAGDGNAAGQGGDGTSGSAGSSSEAGAPGTSTGGSSSTGGARSAGGSSQSGGSDPGDAGAPAGSGAAMGSGAGPGADSGEDGGCGCGVPGEHASNRSSLLGLLALAFAFVRRTARASSRRAAS